MSQLWIRRPDSAGWTPHPLPPAPAEVDLVELLMPEPASASRPVAKLLCRGEGSAAAYFLLTSLGSSVKINSAPLRPGFRSLRDRDAIRLGQALTYLSTETKPAVEPFPGSDSPMFCPRDKTALREGAPAVRCPSCATWHHAEEERPCWLFSPRCAVCGHPTAMDGELTWTPEDL